MLREDDRQATRGDNGASVRTFNTAGPIDPQDHYHIPPLERIDLDEMLGLVRDKKYFVLHAPRQTGKTSALLAQYTAATGQPFTEEALALVRTRTAGQPWLVNALCYDACFRHKPGRDRALAITADAVVAAQERLILRRDTHVDDLANKLREERVRRVVEPILTGAVETTCSDEDLAYVRDLGLVAQADGGPPRIANPIYAEVVPRHLNYAVQETLPQRMAW